jgi:hypothetical protein
MLSIDLKQYFLWKIFFFIFIIIISKDIANLIIADLIDITW